LEGVLLNDYPGDERFEDLVEALALYAGGEPRPYTSAEQVREAIQQALPAL
jgi:hypothetical protein